MRAGGMGIAALAAVLALGALGCGSSSPEVETGGAPGGAPVRDLLALMPADTLAVARVDLQAVRSSPYADTVDRMLATMSEGVPGAEMAGPLLDGTDELVIGITAHRDTGGELDAVIVARGHWAGGEVERALRQPPAGVPPVREEQRSGFTVFAAQDIEIVRLRPDLWAAASPGHLEPLLAAAQQGGSAPLRSQPWFGSLAAQVGFDQATAAAIADLATLQQATGERFRAEQGMELLEQVQSFGGAATIQNGAAIRAVLRMPSSEAASQLATQLGIMLAQLSDNMFVQMMGIGPIVARAEAAASGTNTTVATSADDREMRALLQRLEGLAAMLAQAAAEEMGTGTDPGGIEPMPPPPQAP